MADKLKENPDFFVVGAGVYRTGTFSLRAALETLLNAKCYHMKVVEENPSHIDFWYDAFRKDPSDTEWRDFFKDFKAAIDLPTCCFYQRLIEVFPDAKVVFTLRDVDSWYESIRTTIAKYQLELRESKGQSERTDKFIEMINDMDTKCFGEPVDITNEQQMKSVFTKRIEEVKRVVPADRLLLFDSKDGWGPLCAFLDLPVPTEPYPLLNTRKDFFANFNDLARNG